MKQLTSAQLREMFLKFMESKGCARIQSASVIPECLNDPTVTDEFYVVSNNSDEELRASMRMLETMLRR